LVKAAEENRYEIAKYLIDRGAGVDEPCFGYTLLQKAAYMGHELMAELLLDKGASIDRPPMLSKTTTPLMCAVRGNHISMVKLLSNRGARKDISDAYGRTAKKIARQEKRSEIAKLL